MDRNKTQSKPNNILSYFLCNTTHRIVHSGHPFFHRNGSDILMEYPISFIDAILGTKVKVPTITGKETIKIDPGTEHGKIITLRNKGAPYPNSSQRGDMHVGIVVKFPKKLNKTSKKAIHELEKSIDKKFVFEGNDELLKSLSSLE